MTMDKSILRMGTAVIVAAVLLRLLSGLPTALTDVLYSPRTAEVLLFLQTGRVVRMEDTVSFTPPAEPSVPEETVPAPTEPERPVFTAADAQLVDIRNYCDYPVDTAALLQQPLSWLLTADAPTVLILHTHGTEGYAEQPGYRATDTSQNVVAIGDRITQLLEDSGIRVIHDRSMHDQPSYNGSYDHAREAIQAYLQQYPTIRLVLDIHRDAAEDANGNQIGYTVSTATGEAAKLMLVVGTDAGGLQHPNWQENLSLAVKLHAQLEKLQPGLCRPICLRSSRFNQDLSAGAMLIEVGAAGNSQQEAVLAAEWLTKGLLQLAWGTAATEDSTS